jgi:sulfur-oxidizing protein SoxB
MKNKTTNPRRSFIKKMGVLGLGSIFTPSLLANSNQESPLKNGTHESSSSLHKKEDKITLQLLQTTDVHCQIHPHDELFWENGQAVFRKTGGYAELQTFLKQLKKKHKYTYTVDTGDMFQGSQLSVETTGEAFVPILNEMDYDLYLPGNWEVIYGKTKMQQLMGALNAPKVCTNMYLSLIHI